MKSIKIYTLLFFSLFLLLSCYKTQNNPEVSIPQTDETSDIVTQESTTETTVPDTSGNNDSPATAPDPNTPVKPSLGLKENPVPVPEKEPSPEDSNNGIPRQVGIKITPGEAYTGSLYDIAGKLKEFSLLTTPQEYNDFFKYLGREQWAVVLVRVGNKELWNKMWQMDYEGNENIKTLFPNKSDFTEKMKKFYDAASAGLLSYNEQERGDLSIIFSTESLDTVVNKYCTNDKNPDLTLSPLECRHSVYTFRATSGNHYCDKIDIKTDHGGGAVILCEGLVNYLKL